ncbi:hypothetical protein AVEN_127162-1 [Araneus ventricosus]|uniref:Uncharacterized protein n=1 Tax=Araneus ventricosus TaxID=182803 RepID=A0A4Y2PRM7_ARAVE|nr:hypothetical protein AVEN_127162-1 [Araneus ventricosus]
MGENRENASIKCEVVRSRHTSTSLGLLSRSSPVLACLSDANGDTGRSDTGMALEFARRGGDLPDRGDECNEIGLKFSPDYYLSSTVEYPVQKFSPTGYQIPPVFYKIFPPKLGTPGPPSGATPDLTARQQQTVTATAEIQERPGIFQPVHQSFQRHYLLINDFRSHCFVESIINLKYFI